MTTLIRPARRGGERRARLRRRTAAAAAGLFLGALCGGGGAALAQTADAPPRAGVDADRQRQQPSPEHARERLRQEGALPSEEARREQLRALNEIYRELMPSGRGAVPAPEVAPEPRTRSD